jgi:hypothetical protein
LSRAVVFSVSFPIFTTQSSPAGVALRRWKRNAATARRSRVMPEKRDSYQLANQAEQHSGVQEVPSQQSVDLLIRLLQDFERRSTPAGSALPPDVERDIAAVGAAFKSIESALALEESRDSAVAASPRVVA